MDRNAGSGTAGIRGVRRDGKLGISMRTISTAGDDREMERRKVKKRTGGRKKRKKDWMSARLAIILVMFYAAILGIPSATARYVHVIEKSGTAMAKEFYFTSDLLDGELHTVTAFTDQDGNVSASVTFRLMNHEEEIRYSGVDIEYEVKIVPEEDPDTAGITGINMKGMLEKGMISDIPVTIRGLEPGNTYVVTAVTENTYESRLTGTIEVREADRKSGGDIWTASDSNASVPEDGEIECSQIRGELKEKESSAGE